LQPLSSEEGITRKVFRTFTSGPRPESGLDCLICAEFARQRSCVTLAANSNRVGKGFTQVLGLGVEVSAHGLDCLSFAEFARQRCRPLRWLKPAFSLLRIEILNRAGNSASEILNRADKPFSPIEN